MDIFKHLKGHAVVELQQSTGLRTGHMIAQAEYANEDAPKADGSKVNYLDNGVILKLTGEGKLDLYSDGDGVAYIHADEEHIKVLDNASLDMFTVYLEDGVKVYPRAVALYSGDTFVTDFFSGDLGSMEANTFYKATIEGGIVKVAKDKAEASEKGAIAKKATLASGKEAIEVLWVGGNK